MNYMFNQGSVMGHKDISSTPEDGYYDINGKILKAMDAEWRKYIANIKE